MSHTLNGFYHFKASIVMVATLILPQIATQVYTSLDKPILGLFAVQRKFHIMTNRSELRILF